MKIIKKITLLEVNGGTIEVTIDNKYPRAFVSFYDCKGENERLIVLTMQEIDNLINVLQQAKELAEGKV